MMADIREAVATDTYSNFAAAFIQEMEKGDIPER